MIEGRQEQINFCLNCTKDKCSGTAHFSRDKEFR